MMLIAFIIAYIATCATVAIKVPTMEAGLVVCLGMVAGVVAGLLVGWLQYKWYG